MTDKLLLVTDPDDVLIEGVRIVLVGLSEDQSHMVSQALLRIESMPSVVAYCWNGNNVDWLIDKIYKSQAIIFNAENDNQTLVGYLAGKPNSYYLGNLKFLNQVNNSAIHDMDQCKEILTLIFNKYGK